MCFGPPVIFFLAPAAIRSRTSRRYTWPMPNADRKFSPPRTSPRASGLVTKKSLVFFLIVDIPREMSPTSVTTTSFRGVLSGLGLASVRVSMKSSGLKMRFPCFPFFARQTVISPTPKVELCGKLEFVLFFLEAPLLQCKILTNPL